MAFSGDLLPYSSSRNFSLTLTSGCFSVTSSPSLRVACRPEMDVKICKDMSISLKKLEVYERKKGDEHAFIAVNTRTPREVPAGDHSAGEFITMADLT